MEDAHTKTPAECLAHFTVSETTGLSPDQVKKNLAKYGYNGEIDEMSWRRMQGLIERQPNTVTGGHVSFLGRHRDSITIVLLVKHF